MYELRIRNVSGLPASRAELGRCTLARSRLDHRELLQAACFASSCQSPCPGSPDSPLLGIMHLPLLIPNLLLVVEVCKQGVLSSGIGKLVFMEKINF